MDFQTGVYYYHSKEKRNYLCVEVNKSPHWVEPEEHAADEILYSFKRCKKNSTAIEDHIPVYISDRRWLNQLINQLKEVE